MTPQIYDPKKKYPLILEIHGGPFSNYGFRFSTEVQLYASKGYVVLYVNPRGTRVTVKNLLMKSIIITQTMTMMI